MYRLRRGLLTMIAITLSGAVFADDDSREWQDHGKPYTFLFGNHIDTHQETRLKNNGDLQGFFYIYWTGDFTDDGLPVAKHCTTQEHYEQGCFAGWTIKAKPCIKEVNGCEAMFLYHYHDHPVWMIGPRVDDAGGLRGTRGMIPQPGSYTHLHWLTDPDITNSSLDEVEDLFDVDVAVTPECNVFMASDLIPGVVCPGYFLEIKALAAFAFQHGGELIPVSEGTDNRTHLNIVSSYRSLPAGVLPGDYLEP